MATDLERPGWQARCESGRAARGLLSVVVGLVVVGCPRTEPPARAGLDDGGRDPKLEDAGDGGADARDGSGEGGPSLGLDDLSSPLLAVARVEDSRRLPRPLFERLVADPDVVVRRRALLALGRIGRAEGLDPLRVGLRDEDPDARRLALFSLGQLEASARPDATRILHSFLDLSPPPGDRRAAVEALAQVGSDDARGPLLEALESADSRLRVAAARGLGVLAEAQSPPSEPPRAELVPRLTDPEPEVRLAAAFALSRGAPPSAAAAPAVQAALERALRHDGDAEVRVMAARALGRIGMASPAAATSALESDPDWRVRAMAATAIGTRAPPAVLGKAIEGEWRRVREDPSRLTSPEVHPLVALLGAAAEGPHREATRGLRLVHGEAATRAVAAAEPRQALALSHLRCLAALALDRARGRPALVRRCAVEGAGGPEPWELRALEARAWRGSASVAALRRLRSLADDDDPRVRLAAVETLETLPAEARLAPVERALADPSPAVVAAAAHALAAAAPLFQIAPRPSEQLTVTEHTPDGPVVRSIHHEAIEPPPLPAAALTRALETVDPDANVETAVNLLQTVGRLRVEAAAGPARALAGHHGPAVRREARRALERLGLDPGPEIAPDPPNVIDPVALERLAETRPRIAFETTAGRFVLELRTDLAPATAASLLALVRRGFYEGVRFHRVVPAFVVQVGDPEGTGFGGPGYTVRCELTDEPFRRGSAGMALAGPDTGGSQIFVTLAAQPHLERRYTLFGHVAEGLDVLESIAQWDRILTATVEGDARPPGPGRADGGAT